MASDRYGESGSSTVVSDAPRDGDNSPSRTERSADTTHDSSSTYDRVEERGFRDTPRQRADAVDGTGATSADANQGANGASASAADRDVGALGASFRDSHDSSRPSPAAEQATHEARDAEGDGNEGDDDDVELSASNPEAVHDLAVTTEWRRDREGQTEVEVVRLEYDEKLEPADHLSRDVTVEGTSAQHRSGDASASAEVGGRDGTDRDGTDRDGNNRDGNGQDGPGQDRPDAATSAGYSAVESAVLPIPVVTMTRDLRQESTGQAGDEHSTLFDSPNQSDQRGGNGAEQNDCGDDGNAGEPRQDNDQPRGDTGSPDGGVDHGGNRDDRDGNRDDRDGDHDRPSPDDRPPTDGWPRPDDKAPDDKAPDDRAPGEKAPSDLMPDDRSPDREPDSRLGEVLDRILDKLTDADREVVRIERREDGSVVISYEVEASTTESADGDGRPTGTGSNSPTDSRDGSRGAVAERDDDDD